MRGWHNESMRHSLAARGMKTKYIYHGTGTDRIDSIRKRGLNPKSKKCHEDTHECVYLVTDIESAEEWAYIGLAHRWIDDGHPVILRVKRKDLDRLGILYDDRNYPEVQVPMNGESYEFFETIPPEIIEIRGNDGEWRVLG